MAIYKPAQLALAAKDIPMVNDNIMVENVAEFGGGLRFCYFHGTLPEPLVHGNVIIGNTAWEGGGGLNAEDADPVLDQTTIDGNWAQFFGGGVYAFDGASITLTNSIIANSTSGGGLYAAPYSEIHSSYCDVWNNSGGDYIGCPASITNISCDPEYCNEFEYDVRLHETSCCQGAGDHGYDIGAQPVDCFTVPDVIFYDNFSDQNDDGWHVDTGGAGQIAVEDGTYRGSAANPGDWARSVNSLLATPAADYQVWMEVLPEAVTVEPGGWIDCYLRYLQASQHYRISLNGMQGELWKITDIGMQLLETFPCQLQADHWITLRFVAVDWVLQGFLTDADGVEQLLFHHEDLLAPILTGGVGVGVTEAGPVRARFDDILVARYEEGLTGLPGEGQAGAALSRARLVARASPNPFNPATTIRYELPRAGWLTVRVFDLRGRLVRTLVDAVRPSGPGFIIWNGADENGRWVGSGFYLYRLAAAAQVVQGKLVMLK
ncbi:MAG: hypothetical protein ABIF77_20765 [bacterium]